MISYSDLDDGYYYIMCSPENEELAAMSARDIITQAVVCEKNLPNRPAIIYPEPDFPSNKFIVIWEFGVVGEVKIQPDLHS